MLLKIDIWSKYVTTNGKEVYFFSLLKGTKSGQGILFLPTSMTALRHTFGQLWEAGVKDKISPVLKELLRRGGY